VRRRTRLLHAVFAVFVLAGTASAQVFDRPADERPPLEDFEPEEPPGPPLRLPPAPPVPPQRPPVRTGLEVFVREVRVVGSTVYAPEELALLTQPWTNRELDASEIRDLVDTVTRKYVEDGYVSSGAFLPDQDLDGGVLLVQVVEAVLADVVAQGNRWYRTSFLRRRLQAAVPAPVDMNTLQEQIQLLLQERGIRHIGGALQPGARPGENVLALAVEERIPIGAEASVANDSPPGVGSVQGQLDLADYSLFGLGDVLRARFELSEGLVSEEVHYDLPFTARGTTLELRFRNANSKIVESPFDAADIEADTWTAGIGLRVPLIRTPRMQLWAGVRGEHRRSTTYLSEERESFIPGPIDGVVEINVIRFFSDWSWRSRSDALSARSTVSWGIGRVDVGKLDISATENPSGIPDSRYAAWLGQIQWAHRFPEWALGTTLLARTDLQVANDPLLTLEQIAVGGLGTVRGYRENLLVRDQGVIASLELRIPLLRPFSGGELAGFRLALAPFADFGYAWNVKHTPPVKTLASLGVGLRCSWRDRIDGYAYWGGRLRSVPRSGSNIQEDGFHLGISVRAF